MDQHFPGDLLQIDIVGKLPDSGGFTHILTAKDVFSKYLFAIPLRNASAPNVAKQLFHLFTRNSYIPKTVLSDMGTAFTAKIMTELSKLLEITMQYATVKHPQTVGSVERTHASLKQYLGIYENRLKKDWHTYVDLAAFVHNTSYHVSIGCTPTYLFHGREPVKPLDVRFNLKTIQNLETRYEFTSSMQDRMNEVFSAARDATITAYNKYRTFYDRKAYAAPLSKHRYCLLLNPKLANVNDHMGKSLTKWIPLYRVEQVLTNSNYIVRKVGTNYTQCVHRIRLRPITPQYQIEDLAHIHPNNFVPDPSTRHTSEPSLFDSTLPDLLSDKSFMPTDGVNDSPSVLFYYTPRRVAPPAAPIAPYPHRQPPADPPIAQDPPQDNNNELPVNPTFTLDDVILDTGSSDNNAQNSSSDENSDAFVVSRASLDPNEPSTSTPFRSRTPSRIYSSSELNSSNSTFLGFDSPTLSRADRCLNKPSYTSSGVPADTTVTYTSPSMLTSASFHSQVKTLHPFPSRIPRPVSPIPRSISPKPSTLIPTPQMASSTPTQPTYLQFGPSTSFYPPQPARSPVCDSSAQTSNAELSLQERFPNVIIPRRYDPYYSQSSQSSSRDTRFRQKPKRPPFSTLPHGNNLKNAIFRTFLTKKVTFFTIFSIFLHTYLSDTHKFGTVGFVSLRRIHFHPPFHSVSPFQYQKIDSKITPKKDPKLATHFGV